MNRLKAPPNVLLLGVAAAGAAAEVSETRCASLAHGCSR